MPTLRNINPLGDIDLPLIGRTLARDETFDVTAEQAETLLMQSDNYAPAKTPKATPSGDSATTTTPEG